MLTTYQRCPGEAEGRLNGVYADDTIQSFTGALLHRVIRRHLVEGPIEPEMVPQVCREEIGQGRLNEKMLAVGLRTSSRLAPVFEDVGDRYVRFQGYPEDGFRAAEVDVEVEASEGVTLVGRIDAVFTQDDGVRLVDWKSGGLGDPSSQLGFYALVWSLEHGAMPAEIEAVSVGTGERHREAVTIEWLTTVARDVSAVATELRRHLIHRRPLPLSAGPWCRYCPLSDGCAEGRAALAILDG